MSTSAENVVSPLQRLQRGDVQALAELFEDYRGWLQHFVTERLDSRLSQRIDVDDVLQEVFVDATNRIHHFMESHSGSFFVWIRMITMQTLTNIFRRHLDTRCRDAKKEVSLESRLSNRNEKPVENELLGQLTSPSNAAMRDETAGHLITAIERLKPRDREIIKLRHFEWLDNHEVAELLGIQVKAASIRYVRAIDRLRVLISEMPMLANEYKDDESG